jgi:Transposase DDE domain group 1
MPPNVTLIVRTDCAGCSQDFLAYPRAAKVGFSVGFAVTEGVRDAIRALPDDAWVPAIRQTGTPVTARRWPRSPVCWSCPTTRKGQESLCGKSRCTRRAANPVRHRRGTLHRVATDQPGTNMAELDRVHREHAHVEDRIRGAEDTGARTLPCETFERNAVWLQLVMMAQDLMVWAQALTLDGMLRRAEPATLRYTLLTLRLGSCVRAGA